MSSYKSIRTIIDKGTKMMWDEGPGGAHYENIRGNHAEAGCGIYTTPDGKVWVVQDFK